MKNVKNKKHGSCLVSSMILCVAIFAVALSARAQPNQQVFSSPQEAVNALEKSVKTRDQIGLATIFGPRIGGILSGDPVADRNGFEEFALNIGESSHLEQIGSDRFIVQIGPDKWPFAVPIVKTGAKWRFDTDAGIEELFNRRIGENEFAAISLCQMYAIAQFEYFNGDDRDGDQVSEYAQKISSSAGRKDGLYWARTSDDEEESPLGPLFAWAAFEGYTAKKGTVQSAAPFHGYRFKVVYRQGPSAPGGRFDYIINGNMIAGFALVAYPATWGNSGVMTFIVNQEGRVYEQNLGPATATIAQAMTEYNPDETWSLVDLY